MGKLSQQEIAVLGNSLKLPDDITIDSYLGAGARAHVFKATLDQQPVVVKVYRPEAAGKYRKRYGLDIAEFEYQRNSALFAIDTIRAHIARPYAVFAQHSDYSHALVQQWVDGEQLGKLYRRVGYITDDLIEQGFAIVASASDAGLFDLDMNTGNVFVTREAGKQRLMLCDFNMVPQHLHPPNPALWLAYRLGIRPRSYRDRRNLQKWLQRRKPGSEPWTFADSKKRPR